jgi:TolB-like protein
MSFIDELKRRNVVRVAIAYAVTGWLLVQVADILFEAIGTPPWVMLALLVFLGVGFFIALFFAWAFELTPEGIKREQDVDRTESITPQTGKKLDRAIILGLAAVIVIMAIERVWFAGQDASPPAAVTVQPIADDQQTALVAEVTESEPGGSTGDQQQRSIAVLPFTAMSSGEDDEYFADGLTEEILNSLAGLPELLVTARTSSFHFKGKELPIPEIARTLGVDHVVEGSVRRAGERVRITAQLIRAQDGFHLWSDTYDRTLEDVFAVQEDIAANIAETLDVVLDEEKRRMMRDAGIGNVEAFIAFQKGMAGYDLAHTVSDPATLLAVANEWLDKSLAIVPDIDSALYLRSDLYGHLLMDNATGEKQHPPELLQDALEEIAISLTKSARAARNEPLRAIIEAESLIFSDDWSRIPGLLNLAFTSGYCNPVNWLAEFTYPFTHASLLAALQEDNARCDPLAGWPVVAGGSALIWDGQPERATEMAEAFLARAPFNPWVDDTRFSARLAMEGWEDDPYMFGPTPEGSNFSIPRIVQAYAALGQMDKARAELDKWTAGNSMNDLESLTVAVIFGDRAAANRLAALIDSRIGGPLALSVAVSGCHCGAVFDLEAAPNYQRGIEQAGFTWPPPTRIRYPAKKW